MSRILISLAAVFLFLARPAVSEGQARSATARDTVPVSLLPPAGKCRIWMDGVPAAQQPAATDCATALRQRPANGKILYGPSSGDTRGGRFEPLERGGSNAERALQRRRVEQEYEKRAAESRERRERAQEDAVNRAKLMTSGQARPGEPANARSGEGSASGTTKAPPPPAGPAKKKPE